jgi:hypothetical protein
MCILRDLINVRPSNLCKPNGPKTTYSSAAPVQVGNFRQSVVGQNKIQFSFDIILSGNVDIFWNDLTEATPADGFEAACPREARARRSVENNVGVEITEIPEDPIFLSGSVKCGGLDNSFTGTVKLISGRRTIICTAELVRDRLDLEKVIGVNLVYNVLDDKETKVLIKHFADI